MSPESVEELENKLTKNLARRKKELLFLKSKIAESDSEYNSLARAACVMLCAHFEGFIKDSSNYYIEYIANQKILYKKLKPNFKVLKMQKTFDKANFSVGLRLINDIETLNSKIFTLDNGTTISTHSNPSSTELEKILCLLGIKSDLFELKKVYIDKSLLKKRNEIAHGTMSDVAASDFNEMINIILELMDGYSNIIVDAAEQKLYLKEGA